MPAPMDISVKYIRDTLARCHPRPEASALARVVCCEELGLSSADYFLGKDITLSPKDEQKLESILARLCRHEPVQYVLGRARFLGRDFHVEPGVLIPRPETEELVELILRELSGTPRVLDVGTGSGCIAVTLALEMPGAEVCAWDVSPRALEVAQANCRLLHAAVDFRLRDVFACDPQDGGQYDAIVSNPPYVAEAEKRDMAPEVLDWEPSEALFVPDDDPLRYYRRIGRLGLERLKPGGRIYLEINRAYGPQLLQLFRGQGYGDMRLLKDLSGNDRFVVLRHPGGGPACFKE